MDIFAETYVQQWLSSGGYGGGDEDYYVECRVIKYFVTGVSVLVTTPSGGRRGLTMNSTGRLLRNSQRFR